MRNNTRIRVSVGRFLLAFCACLLPATSAAQPTSDTLRLQTVLEATGTTNPAILAARLNADIFAERVPRAGSLPDPILSIGLMNRVVDGFGTGTAMSMNSIQFTQRLPWPGKLGFSKSRVSHIAQAMRLDAAEMELQLLAQAKSVYFTIAYMDRAVTLMEDTHARLSDFLEVAASMYSAGNALQQDVLQAQVAIAKIVEDITVVQQSRSAAAARLNRLMSRDVSTPLPPLELPNIYDTLPPVEHLVALATRTSPAFEAASERILAAEAGVKAAGRAMYPDLSFTLGYGHRPDFPDVASVMVGFNIPLWAKSNQKPLRREMEVARSLEETNAIDLRQETEARLAELYAEAARDHRLFELYTSSILPQAGAAVETALSAYRVGSTEFLTLVDSQMTKNRYSIEAVRLKADYHRTVALIEALVGRPIGGTQ